MQVFLMNVRKVLAGCFMPLLFVTIPSTSLAQSYDVLAECTSLSSNIDDIHACQQYVIGATGQT